MLLSAHPLTLLRPHLNRWSVALLVLLGSGAVSAQKSQQGASAGLGVFGPVLGIHNHDTLVVKGDVVLKRATIVGMGTLSLRSHRPQHLLANHSQGQHLHLANALGVTLEGDLRVEKDLTVDSGVLDASLATLTLGNDAHILVRAGGQVKRSPTVARAERDRMADSTPAGGSNATVIENNSKFLVVNQLIVDHQFADGRLIWQADLPQQPSPPPEA